MFGTGEAVRMRSRVRGEPPRPANRQWGSSRKKAAAIETLLEIEGGTQAASIGEGYRRAMLWLFRDADLAPR